jgi:hypothetical protein
LAVTISLFVSAHLRFAAQDRERATINAPRIPSVPGFGIYFNLATLMGRRK